MSLIRAFHERWVHHRGESGEWLWVFLSQIATFNSRINAVAELNPNALFEAEGMDSLSESDPDAILKGVPVLIKDNIAVAGFLHTTAGSLALKDNYASADAFVVKQIRKRGGIILGKSHLTEWANFMSDHMVNGYSSYGGQVLNPYGPGIFDVGGSSSGSGAGVAAGFAPVALGTETSGSILSPSGRNSVVGIKPTVGLVSRSGIVPISFSQDTAGPMASSVSDAAILLTAIQGYDPDDPATRMAPGYPDYRHDLVKDGLKNRRIGVPRYHYLDHTEDEDLYLLEMALSRMSTLGARIVDPADIHVAKENWTYDVLLYEFPVTLNAYLRQWTSQGPRTLQEVIEFNNAHSQEMLLYGQSVLMEAYSTRGRLTDRRYLLARRQDVMWSRTQGIDRTLQTHQLDALVFLGSSGADIAARAGYPSITVPLGYTRLGKPVGLTFTAGAFQESLLIQMAFAFEQATQFFRPPAMT